MEHGSVTSIMDEGFAIPPKRCDKCNVGGKGTSHGTSETLYSLSGHVAYEVKCGFCGAVLWYKKVITDLAKEANNQ